MSTINALQDHLQHQLLRHGLDDSFTHSISTMVKIIKHLSDRLFPFRVDHPDATNIVSADAAEAIKQFQIRVQAEREESRLEIDAMAEDIVQAIQHFQDQVQAEISKFINARESLPQLPSDSAWFSTEEAYGIFLLWAIGRWKAAMPEPHNSRKLEESIIHNFAQFFHLCTFKPLLMTHRQDSSHPCWLSQPALTKINISLEDLCSSYQYLNSTIDRIEKRMTKAVMCLAELPLNVKIMVYKCRSAMSAAGCLPPLREAFVPSHHQITQCLGDQLGFSTAASLRADPRSRLQRDRIHDQALMSEKLSNTPHEAALSNAVASVGRNHNLNESPVRLLRRPQTSPVPYAHCERTSPEFLFPLRTRKCSAGSDDSFAGRKSKESKRTKIKTAFGTARPQNPSSDANDANAVSNHQLSRSFPIPHNYTVADNLNKGRSVSSSFPPPHPRTTSATRQGHRSSSGSSFSSNASASSLKLDPCIPSLIRNDHHAVSRTRKSSKNYSVCLSDCVEEPDLNESDQPASKAPATPVPSPITAIPLSSSLSFPGTVEPARQQQPGKRIHSEAHKTTSHHPRAESSPEPIVQTINAGSTTDVHGFDAQDSRVARRRQQHRQFQQRVVAARLDLEQKRSERARARQLTL